MNKRVVFIGLGSLLVVLLLTGCFLFQLEFWGHST